MEPSVKPKLQGLRKPRAVGGIPRAENGATIGAEAVTVWPSGCAGSVH